MDFAHKYARIEDERRFLLARLPANLTGSAPTRIIDHYWPGTRLRLRRIETLEGEVLQRKLTQKYPAPDRPRQETVITNTYLSGEEYALFWQIKGKRLAKVRYHYLHQGSGYSLDVFEAGLQGLLLAELEAGQGSLPAGRVPDFAACEVTAEPRFTGGMLVQTTPKSLAELLAEWLGGQR